MIKSTRSQGYYTVEAAIFLPLFLVAALTIGYFIKVVGCIESGMHGAVDESRRQAALAYVDRGGGGFSQRVKDRILYENEFIDEVTISRMDYLGGDGRISFDMDYRMDVKLPLGMYDGFDLKDRLKCRGWIGRKGTDPFGFDRMERDEDSCMVYIFPMWGSKYHKQNCTYVTAHPVQTTLTDGIKKDYDPCVLCKPATLSPGSVIYYFPKYGGSYHRGDCKSIKKYTITIEVEQAEKRGYSPCSKCGGM